MSLFVKGIQGISSSCPILMKQSKVISRQVSCFSPILDMSPFVEHVGSVQLLSKNKTARDILTKDVFVFPVRFVHTCISIFCHLCLLLLCLWSHVISVAHCRAQNDRLTPRRSGFLYLSLNDICCSPILLQVLKHSIYGVFMIYEIRLAVSTFRVKSKISFSSPDKRLGEKVQVA